MGAGEIPCPRLVNTITSALFCLFVLIETYNILLSFSSFVCPHFEVGGTNPGISRRIRTRRETMNFYGLFPYRQIRMFFRVKIRKSPPVSRGTRYFPITERPSRRPRKGYAAAMGRRKWEAVGRVERRGQAFSLPRPFRSAAIPHCFRRFATSGCVWKSFSRMTPGSPKILRRYIWTKSRSLPGTRQARTRYFSSPFGIDWMTSTESGVNPKSMQASTARDLGSCPDFRIS